MHASGRLENVHTGASHSFRTDENGRFTLGNLSYGRYRLEVSGQGFATQSFLVDVQSNNPVSRTITMALGVESARVDVVAATPVAGSNLSLQEMPGQSRLRPARTVTTAVP
jgi:hypothetical protein